MLDVLVRRARLEDKEAVENLLDRSWRTHWAPHLDFRALAQYEATRPVEGYVGAYLDRFMVAEREGVVVGMYHLDGSHLHAIHVDFWAIGSGIGSALMDHAEAAGAARLEVRAFNIRAREFYTTRGWLEVSEYEDAEMGMPVRTIAMEL
jgi:ribosomal protein S18 acetylase RimI-like enzyme